MWGRGGERANGRGEHRARAKREDGQCREEEGEAELARWCDEAIVAKQRKWREGGPSCAAYCKARARLGCSGAMKRGFVRC